MHSPVVHYDIGNDIVRMEMMGFLRRAIYCHVRAHGWQEHPSDYADYSESGDPFDVTLPIDLLTSSERRHVIG